MLTVDDDVCTVLGDIMDDLWHNRMGEEDRRIVRSMEEVEEDDTFEVHAAYLVAEASKIWPGEDVGVGRTGEAGQYSLDVADSTVVQGTWLDLYEYVAARRPVLPAKGGG